MLSSVFTVLFICALEGLLSLDNALVLAILVKSLPPGQRRRALTYGIVGAFAFRAVALFFVTEIIGSPWVKILGGLYLLYIAGKFFVDSGGDDDENRFAEPRSFWRTVIAVELMDIVFSIDSILAAVGVSQDYKIVLAGGIVGIIMMRFASTLFSKLLDRFPRLEVTAHLLIATIGAKLIAETAGLDTHSTSSPYTWVFALAFVVSIVCGFFTPKAKERTQ